ncbi:MAG TPA: exo-alpha-sialidase, partial [Candidatus Thermoplasmatota archaeon]|nr:exo-alpha-sialidase [Candidatus Thermoplasmatota archaeon]
DHQTLAAGKPRVSSTVGYPNVVYQCINRITDSICTRSLDGGISWSPGAPVFLGYDATRASPSFEGALDGLCGGLHGHVVAAPDGTVYLPSSDCSVRQSPPLVSVTQDDGLTWTTHVISKDHPTDSHEVGIAVDEAGNVYANWISDGRMLLAHSTDAGKTWSAPIDVTAPGVTATAFNAVAAGAPGRVALAYVGTTIEGGYARGMAADDWKGATWNAYLAVLPDALAAQPVIQSVTANDPADPVARGVCGRTRCSGMTDFIELVVDAQGRPWASFVDVCTGGCAKAGGEKNEGNEGFVATLRAGPALRGDLVALPLLPAAP